MLRFKNICLFLFILCSQVDNLWREWFWAMASSKINFQIICNRMVCEAKTMKHTTTKTDAKLSWINSCRIWIEIRRRRRERNSKNWEKKIEERGKVRWKEHVVRKLYQIESLLFYRAYVLMNGRMAEWLELKENGWRRLLRVRRFQNR